MLGLAEPRAEEQVRDGGDGGPRPRKTPRSGQDEHADGTEEHMRDLHIGDRGQIERRTQRTEDPPHGEIHSGLRIHVNREAARNERRPGQRMGAPDRGGDERGSRAVAADEIPLKCPVAEHLPDEHTNREGEEKPDGDPGFQVSLTYPSGHAPHDVCGTDPRFLSDSPGTIRGRGHALA